MTRIFHRLFLWKWIPCQAVTTVLCLLFRPKTVHCSTKDAYTSEITSLALVPCLDGNRVNSEARTFVLVISRSNIDSYLNAELRIYDFSFSMVVISCRDNFYESLNLKAATLHWIFRYSTQDKQHLQKFWSLSKKKIKNVFNLFKVEVQGFVPWLKEEEGFLDHPDTVDPYWSCSFSSKFCNLYQK